MLQNPKRSSPRSRIAATAVVVLAIGAIVPFRLVARPATQASDAAGPVIAAQSATAESALPIDQSKPPTPPRPPVRVDEAVEHPDDMRFVLFFDNQRTTMSGRSGDVARARRLRTSMEPLLWFIQDNREYVVRSQAVLAEIESIWDQVGRVGQEQGVIGAKQGMIGARQGEIGAKQAAIGAEQASIGARQARVGEQQATLAIRDMRAKTESERESIDRERRSLDNEMRALDAKMAQLNDRMHEFEKPMNELSEEMEGLGRQMEKLGRQMEDASRKAEADMRALLRRAVESGAAQPVR